MMHEGQTCVFQCFHQQEMALDTSLLPKLAKYESETYFIMTILCDYSLNMIGFTIKR